MKDFDSYTSEEDFKRDLFNFLKIENNPKKDMLYNKAYEMGHSDGWQDIFAIASNIVDLIK